VNVEPSDAGHATVADEDEAGAEVPVDDPEAPGDPVELLVDDVVGSEGVIELVTDEAALDPTELDAEVVVRALYECQPTRRDRSSKRGVRVMMDTYEEELGEDEPVEEPSRVRKSSFTAP